MERVGRVLRGAPRTAQDEGWRGRLLDTATPLQGGGCSYGRSRGAGEVSHERKSAL